MIVVLVVLGDIEREARQRCHCEKLKLCEVPVNETCLGELFEENVRGGLE